MIKVIVGKKGTGKTKRVIEMANKSIESTVGNIVFIGGNSRRMMELSHKVRFINAQEFELSDFKVFYGFLSGVIAGDYDIAQIYIDGVLDIINDKLGSIENFLFYIKKLSDRFKIKFIITLSGDPETMPIFLKEYIA